MRTQFLCSHRPDLYGGRPMTIRRFLKPALGARPPPAGPNDRDCLPPCSPGVLAASPPLPPPVPSTPSSASGQRQVPRRARRGRLYSPGARVEQHHCTRRRRSSSGGWSGRTRPTVPSRRRDHQPAQRPCPRAGCPTPSTARRPSRWRAPAPTSYAFFISNGNGYFLRNTFDYRCLDRVRQLDADHALIQIGRATGRTPALAEQLVLPAEGSGKPVTQRVRAARRSRRAARTRCGAGSSRRP